MAKHKKYSILEFAIPLGNYDLNTGGGYGKDINFRGERSSGSPYGIYDDPSLDDDDEESCEDDSLDNIDIASKINYSLSQPRIDIGRSDPGGTSFDNIGYAYGSAASLAEVTIDPRDDSNNPVPMGISPRLSYRSATNTKGPSISGMASSHYITNAPGRIHGTEKGTSRAPAPLPGEENVNPIFSLTDLLDSPDEYAIRKFRSQENKVKKIIESIIFFILD